MGLSTQAKARAVVMTAPCRILFSGLILGSLLGCDDPLLDPQLIERPRVITGRVSTLDDQLEPEAIGGRSQLQPGELGTVEFLTVGPDDTERNSLLRLCKAEPTMLGLPQCAAVPFLETTQTITPNSVTATEFRLTEALRPGDDWLAYHGSCESEISYDAAKDLFVCADDESPLVSVLRTTVSTGDENRHPSFIASELRLNGERWPALSETRLPQPGTRCDDVAPAPQGDAEDSESIARLREGTNTVELTFNDDPREALPEELDGYAAAPHESLVFSHFATEPVLERAFSALDFELSEDDLELEIELIVDADEVATDSVVLFYLVMRDERGGLDWLVRPLCTPK